MHIKKNLSYKNWNCILPKTLEIFIHFTPDNTKFQFYIFFCVYNRRGLIEVSNYCFLHGNT